MYQPALLLPTAPVRTALGDGAWIEVCSSWFVDDGSLFDALIANVPWQAERRMMYERLVDVPRLHHFVDAGDPLPDRRLDTLRDRLNDAFAAELGEPFVSIGLCLYRNGRDSVAWHGDRIGRGSTSDTMVAILSLGAERRLSLRPAGGGPSRSVPMACGDLLVMGGSCQRTWEHAVLKTAHPVGPRISVQFRVAGVR